MKFLLALGAVVVFSVQVLAGTDIIYGDDDRQDIANSGDWKIASLSHAVATMIPRDRLKKVGTKHFEFTGVRTLSEEMQLCSGQKFENQPTAGECTGFLVASDILVTAGHCVLGEAERSVTNERNRGCANMSWVFDYAANRDGETNLTRGKLSSVYGCSKIIKAYNLDEISDYAIIKLDRKVTGRMPLKVNFNKKIRKNQSIFVIGHPSGLPMKYAGGAKVFDIKSQYFTTNLDTFGGNSGSPVFNATTYEVEGILVRGETDYTQHPEGFACDVVNRCDQNRKNCTEEVSDMDGEHVTIMAHLKSFI